MTYSNHIWNMSPFNLTMTFDIKKTFPKAATIFSPNTQSHINGSQLLKRYLKS